MKMGEMTRGIWGTRKSSVPCLGGGGGEVGRGGYPVPSSGGEEGEGGIIPELIWNTVPPLTPPLPGEQTENITFPHLSDTQPHVNMLS